MILRRVTYRQFKQESANKKIVCIGAGQLFSDMFTIFENDVLERIIAVADNKNISTVKSVASYEFKIDKITDIKDQFSDGKKYCILITTMYARSLFEQLNTYKELTDVDCYIYTLMSITTEEYKYVPTQKTQMIPKIIHWCWFGGEQIPDENLKCIESWKRFCPDYEIIKWTEDSFDIGKCEYAKQAYNNGKWAFVSDFARLDIIYNYGGIYLDTDVELVKNLDELLMCDAFAGFQRNFHIGLGLGYGSKMKNDVIKDMRDLYYQIPFEKDGKLNLTACPVYQTSILKQKGLLCNNSFQVLGDITIFPTDAFDCKSFPKARARRTDNTFSIHHYSESWIDSEIKYKNKERYEEIMDFVTD